MAKPMDDDGQDQAAEKDGRADPGATHRCRHSRTHDGTRCQEVTGDQRATSRESQPNAA